MCCSGNRSQRTRRLAVLIIQKCRFIRPGNVGKTLGTAVLYDSIAHCPDLLLVHRGPMRPIAALYSSSTRRSQHLFERARTIRILHTRQPSWTWIRRSWTWIRRRWDEPGDERRDSVAPASKNTRANRLAPIKRDRDYYRGYYLAERAFQALLRPQSLSWQRDAGYFDVGWGPLDWPWVGGKHPRITMTYHQIIDKWLRAYLDPGGYND
jgi:hypothetical protein